MPKSLRNEGAWLGGDISLGEEKRQGSQMAGASGEPEFRSFQLKHLTYRQVKMGEPEAGIHTPPSSCSGYSCDVWSCGSDNHGANANAFRVVKKEVRVPDGMLGS